MRIELGPLKIFRDRLVNAQRALTHAQEIGLDALTRQAAQHLPEELAPVWAKNSREAKAMAINTPAVFEAPTAEQAVIVDFTTAILTIKSVENAGLPDTTVDQLESTIMDFAIDLARNHSVINTGTSHKNKKVPLSDQNFRSYCRNAIASSFIMFSEVLNLDYKVDRTQSEQRLSQKVALMEYAKKSDDSANQQPSEGKNPVTESEMLEYLKELSANFKARQEVSKVT